MNAFKLNNNYLQSPLQPRPNTTAHTTRARRLTSGDPSLPIATLRPLTTRSSSSHRNAKAKMDTLHDNLTHLSRDIEATRDTFTDMRLHLSFLKEQLTLRGIQPMRAGLVQEIRQLQRSLQIRRRSDLLRYQALQSTCTALNRNSKEIRIRLFTVGEQVGRMEDLLGYAGVRGKLKY